MSLFDNTRALKEGWDLFDIEGRYCLQRIDVPSDDEFLGYKEPKFASDSMAIIFVAQKAYQGSDYHWGALDRIGMLVEADT